MLKKYVHYLMGWIVGVNYGIGMYWLFVNGFLVLPGLFIGTIFMFMISVGVMAFLEVVERDDKKAHNES